MVISQEIHLIHEVYNGGVGGEDWITTHSDVSTQADIAFVLGNESTVLHCVFVDLNNDQPSHFIYFSLPIITVSLRAVALDFSFKFQSF